MREQPDPIAEFRAAISNQKFKTVLADPPWQFINRTGKVAPEHRRLNRYGTITVKEIGAKVVHGRYVTFQLAEVAVPRPLFAEILRFIDQLRPKPATT